MVCGCGLDVDGRTDSVVARDALGVKLGHRRVWKKESCVESCGWESFINTPRQKLQRRIANARGIAPDAALVSPTRSSVEDSRPEAAQRPDGPATPTTDTRDAGTTVVQKRKYRRHPKVCPSTRINVG